MKNLMMWKRKKGRKKVKSLGKLVKKISLLPDSEEDEISGNTEKELSANRASCYPAILSTTSWKWFFKWVKQQWLEDNKYG